MSTNAALGDWENIISQGINGAPYPVMIDAVRTAAIEFCRETRIDRRLVLQLDYDPASPDTLLPNGADNEFPVTVLSLWTDNGEIVATTHRKLAQDYPSGYLSLTGEVSEVTGYMSMRPGTVRMFPAPTAATKIDMMIAYQPKRNAVYVPQFLYELYAHEIGDGALAYLHSHDKAPYADPGRYTVHRRLFEEAMQKHGDRGDAGFNRSRREIRAERGI